MQENWYNFLITQCLTSQKTKHLGYVKVITEQCPIVQCSAINHTRSMSSSSAISSSIQCLLRYVWRLPLTMKGITMYGAWQSRQIPKIPITWGCINAFIFRHSFRKSTISLWPRNPKAQKGNN